MASRLTSSYIVEKRTFLSVTKYLLEIKMPDERGKHFIVLKHTKFDEDKPEEIDLKDVNDVIVDTESSDQFTIVKSDGERVQLYTQERNRLLTEIAIQREDLAWAVPNQLDLATKKKITDLLKRIPKVKHFQDIFSENPDETTQEVEFLVTTFGVCAFSEKNEDEDDYVPQKQTGVHTPAQGGNLMYKSGILQAGRKTGDYDESPENTWIFYADIDQIIHNKELMYIVKKNKEIEKFYFMTKTQNQVSYPASRTPVVTEEQNYSANETINFMFQNCSKTLTSPLKHFNVNDLDDHYVFQQTAMSEVREVRNRLFMCRASSNLSNKEVEIELFNDELQIWSRNTEQHDGKKKQEIQKQLFKAHLGSLQRIVVLKPYESGKLLLTFHFEKANSYREIELQMVQNEGGEKEKAQHQKLTEFLSSVLSLRELLQRSPAQSLQFTAYNKIQVIALPSKPKYNETVMGSLPKSPESQRAVQILRETVDADYEQYTFKTLISILDPESESPAVKAPYKGPQTAGSQIFYDSAGTERQSFHQTLDKKHLQQNNNVSPQIGPGSQMQEFAGALPKERRASMYKQTTEEQIIDALRAINENCNFFSLNKVDPRQFRIFSQALRAQIDEFWTLELEGENDQSFQYHESELDTDSDDEEKFIEQGHPSGFENDPQDSNSDVNSKESDSFVSDASIVKSDYDSDDNVIKKQDKDQNRMDFAVEMLSRMLITFQKLMQSRQLFREISQLSDHHNRILMRGILKLLKSENVFITYLASQCIVSVLKFCDASEQKAETKNKEFMIGNEINIMKYLERHLCSHKRYLILHSGALKCNLDVKMVADILTALLCDRGASQLENPDSDLRLRSNKPLKFLYESSLPRNEEIPVTQDRKPGQLRESQATRVGGVGTSTGGQRAITNRLIGHHNLSESVKLGKQPRRAEFIYQIKVDGGKSSGEVIIKGGNISNTTRPEDLFAVVVSLFANDFKLMHIIDRLSISTPVLIQLAFGRIISNVLSFCQSDQYVKLVSEYDGFWRMTAQSFGQIQYRIFGSSVQLLHHARILILDSVPLEAQRIQSLFMFSTLMQQNPYAVGVIKRTFKKFLLKHVQTNLKDTSTWGQIEWFNFFREVRDDFKGPLKMWNQESKQELQKFLEMEIHRFKDTQEKHSKAVLVQSRNKNERVLTHLTHSFDHDGRIQSTFVNLKWNFEEFQAHYSNEQSLCKVWKYYLQELLIDGVFADKDKETEGRPPKLHADLVSQDINELWFQLLQRYMPGKNKDEKVLILKILILLYQNYRVEIGSLQIMPYWLKQLEQDQSGQIHFLILQLLLTALTPCPLKNESANKRQEEITQENQKQFDKVKGLSIVIGCLNFGFKELKNSAHYRKLVHEKEKNMIEVHQDEHQSDGLEQEIVDVLEADNLSGPQLVTNASHQEIKTQDLDVIKHARHKRTHTDALGFQHSTDFVESRQFRAATTDEHFNDGDDEIFQTHAGAAYDQHHDEEHNEQLRLQTELTLGGPQSMNYALNAIKDASYFHQDNMNINIALIAFRLIDLIMNLSKNKEMYPLPLSKQLFLSQQNIAVVVQLLLVGNHNLTHEIIEFITKHLNSHYSLYQFRNSGIIEFLILQLDQEEANSERAFNLIRLFQDVLMDQNKEILQHKDAFFDENDRKVLDQNQDDITKGIALSTIQIRNSLLLKYMPIPLIMKALQQSHPRDAQTAASEQDNFLKIFNSQQYEKATLIWNIEMREHLKDTIYTNVIDLMRELKEYSQDPKDGQIVNFAGKDHLLDRYNQAELASNNKSLVLKTEEIPIYKGFIQKRIAYKNINDEVRCGQYYLRIWVDQKNKLANPANQESGFFRIPEKEEKEFLRNLTNSFEDFLSFIYRSTEREENSYYLETTQTESRTDNLTILVKACLFAAQSFKTKSFDCLDKLINLIDQIAQYFTKSQTNDAVVVHSGKFSFNKTIQQILLLSVQAIFTAIDTEKEERNIKDLESQRVVNEDKMKVFCKVEDLKDQIKMQKSNLDKLNKQNGIQLLQSVISLVLLYSKNPRFDGNEIQHKRDRFGILKNQEAQIIMYCTKTIQQLIIQDKDNYFKTSFKERFEMFKQLTETLHVAERLYEGLLKQKVTMKEPGLHRRKSHRKSLSSHRSLATFNPQRKLSIVVEGDNCPSPANMSRTNRLNPAVTSNRKMGRLGKFTSNKTIINASESRSPTNLLEETTMHEDNFDLQVNHAELQKWFSSAAQSVALIQDERIKKQNAQNKVTQTLRLAEAIFSLGSTVSEMGDFHQELIRSGFIWRTLQFNFFNIQREFIRQFGIFENILTDCAIILIQTASFANKKNQQKSTVTPFHHNYDQYQGVASSASGHKLVPKLDLGGMGDSVKEEQSTTNNFWESLRKLLPRKILDKLITPFTTHGFDRFATGKVNEDKPQDTPRKSTRTALNVSTRDVYEVVSDLKFFMNFDPQVRRDYALKFRKLFSIDEERTPELIWNDSMREELRICLKNQLGDMRIRMNCSLYTPNASLSMSNFDVKSEDDKPKTENFHSIIDDFDFEINKNELKIDDIFVKHFNSDIYFRPQNVRNFVNNLFSEIRDKVESENSRLETDERVFDNLLEMTKALRNLIQYQNVLNTTSFQFDENISLFCKMTNSGKHHQDAHSRLSAIRGIVFDILKIISSQKVFAEYLLRNLEFVKLVASSFESTGSGIAENSQNNLELKKMENLVKILSNIFEYEQEEAEDLDYDIKAFLNNYGLVMFFLNVILNKNQPKEIRCQVTRILLKHIQDDKVCEEYIGAMLPIQFFTMAAYAQGYQFLSGVKDMIKKLIDDLDAEQYENVFLMWDTTLRENQLKNIQCECDEIMKQMNNVRKDEFDKLVVNLPTTHFTNPRTKHEVLIDKIITRVYNTNPGLYIDLKFEECIDKLSRKFQDQVFILNSIHTIFETQQIDYDAQNEEIWIEYDKREPKQGMMKNRMKKIYRYLAQQTLYVVTSLTLCLEQLLFNPHNPVKLQKDSERQEETKANMLTTGKASMMATYSQFQNFQASSAARVSVRKTSAVITRDRDNTIINKPPFLEEAEQIPGSFVQALTEQFASMAMLSKTLPFELRIMFLQLLSMIFDGAIDFDKPENIFMFESLGKYLKGALEMVQQGYDAEKPLEGNLVLVLILKFLKIWGKQRIEEIFEDTHCVDKLVTLCRTKRQFRRIAEAVLCQIAKSNQVFKNHLRSLQEAGGGIDGTDAHDIAWDDIFLNKRNVPAEQINNLWRKGPNEDEAHEYYDCRKSAVLEDKLDESNLSKIKLPMLSKKSTSEIGTGDKLDPEDFDYMHKLVKSIKSNVSKHPFDEAAEMTD